MGKENILGIVMLAVFLVSCQGFPIAAPTPTYIIPTKSPEPTGLIFEHLHQGTPIPSPAPSIFPPPDVQISPNLSIAHLQMFDINTGWAVYSTPFRRPENSKILRTSEGIQNWIDVTPPISETGSSIRAAFWGDLNRAVVVSSRSFLPESPAVDVILWRTMNGGFTWQPGESFRIDQASEFYPDQLLFTNQEHGWMLGVSDSGMQNLRVHILETQDGGLHWDSVYDSAEHISDRVTLWIKGYYPFAEHIAFTSEAAGFFSDGRLFSSQDGGSSWLSHPLNPPSDLPDIDCQGGDCKYLDIVSVPRFSSSRDGVLIRRAYFNSDSVMDVFVYYPNTLNRLPIPAAQYLYLTHDGGQTWTPWLAPLRIGTVYFRDAQTGWFLGKNDPDPTSLTQLFQSVDGGETWLQIAADCPLPLGSELLFLDEQNGFAYYPAEVIDFYRDFDHRIGQTTALFSTQDGGRSWVMVQPQVHP